MVTVRRGACVQPHRGRNVRNAAYNHRRGKRLPHETHRNSTTRLQNQHSSTPAQQHSSTPAPARQRIAECAGIIDIPSRGGSMGMKFWISVIAMFVVSMAVGFVVHAMFLGPEYARLGTLFRPASDAQNYFWAMLLAHVFIAIAFTWIYLRGRESRPFLGQGIRYGIAVALLTAVPVYLIYYAVQPMPGALVVKQIAADTIGYVIMGVVLAWINRQA
jgi:hypothetical protein